MNMLNRKGFFSTLFGGIAGVVAGSNVKASEPPVEKTITCDKLIFTHSSGAKCELSMIDSDRFEIRVNDSSMVTLHSPFEKPIVKASKLYGIEYSSLIFELGNRKLVAGQEDLILEVAQKLKENK